MAIRSMTGFGRASLTHGDSTYVVEIRAVNHRYLDLKIRLPRELASLEPGVRAAVTQRIARGRVDVNVGTGGDDDTPRAHAVAVDQALARSVLRAHQALAAQLGIPLRLDTGDLCAVPGVLVPVVEEVGGPELAAAVLAGVGSAADALVAMRLAEGVALAAELGRRLDAVAELRGRIAERAPEQGRLYRLRVEARLRELLATLDVAADQSRILHEVGIFAERVDIAEEVARLDSHVAQARGWLSGGEPVASEEGVGRRMDFLCQEMHREANTIGSKIQDLELSQRVIALKAELERLREQVQNVE